MASGETLVLTYTISATDDDATPLADTETVTITISGTNDAPIITDGPDAVSLTETNAGLSSTGTMTVTDIDLSDVVMASVDSVSVTGTGAASVPGTLTNSNLENFLSVTPTTILNGSQNEATLTWDFDSSSEAFDFLNSGDTLILTYTVSVTDDDGAPLSDTETVTVTITGTNDEPVAVVDNATALEAGGDNNATPGFDPTGNVLTNDTDLDDGDTQEVVGVAAGVTGSASGSVGASVAGMYGSVTIQSDGSYVYNVDNSNAAVEALRTATDTLDDVFTYTMVDEDGAQSTQQSRLLSKVPMTIRLT